jgi:hypothetical protein
MITTTDLIRSVTEQRRKELEHTTFLRRLRKQRKATSSPEVSG